MQIHSLCQHCLWRGSCAAAESNCNDKGVVTDPKATAGATDYIDIPWCLDPYDPDALDLVDVDGQWYPTPQAHTIHLIKERIFTMSIFERSYPKESKAINAPTVITHYPGDDFCRIVATEYWSRKMIGDLSLLMPSVHILREDDKVIEAEFPAEWLFLEPMEDKRPGVPPFLDHAAPGMTPSETGPYGRDNL